MKFGVYIHIPYCRQICPYCDFTRYAFGKIMAPDKYIELLAKEIRARAPDVSKRELSTIYFGGGTPSLFSPQEILSILDELAKNGFTWDSETEITLEIDPATADESRLDGYLDLGINRFSVGAQTFNSSLLKLAGRKHSREDTVELLNLLKKKSLNFSFDLLFGLPTQSIADLNMDLAQALDFGPSHLSAYCLNVPDNHPMAKGRAPDEEQAEMFDVIESALAENGIFRYEISNFSKLGYESRHNLLYWTDQAYWGLGTSSHSYFPKGFSPEVDTHGDWGLRFWNAPRIGAYETEIAKTSSNWSFMRDVASEQKELLEKHQSLTDFCHTSLRLASGLDENALRLKFGTAVAAAVSSLLENLKSRGLVAQTKSGFALTSQGRVLANTVFEKLTFLRDDLRP